ncbi:cystine/glutamate transporter [Aplysia californica]|uniref:Cystine/glutamate transporter n=1 Tax=Aplysia californica TaxID=6500 RepID=A0ABM0ZUR1_APLCA|nr:cystine/glutamate transporter [Aplysia californica]
MDRVQAFRRGSMPNGRRPSVMWTLGSQRQADSEKGGGPGGGDAEGGGAKKEEKAGSDLQEIGLLYGGSLVMNAIIGPGIFGTPKGVLAGVGSVGMCMVMWTLAGMFSMCGPGIFGTPKGVLAGVGSVGMCMVMWTLAGMFSMCAALCFAELRESVRREGVEYAYITEAFGPLAGFVYSSIRIAAAEPVSTAVFALAFADYVSDSIYDDCGPPRPVVIVIATLTTLSMALVNLMSRKLSERLQMLSSVGKTCALAVVIIMGIKRMIDGELDVINEGMTGTKFSASQFGFALYNGLWAYGGWSNVNHVTSGLKKPPRNVPRIVKTVLPLVLMVYLLVVLSYFTAMTREELLNSQAIGVTWAQNVLGPASSIISIGVGLTALGSLNATFLSAGRLSGVAAKNGQMPDVASWVHVRSKTPVITVVLRCVIATVAICVGTGQSLLRFYVFCVWLFHGMSVVALLVLRFKNKHKKRPYKVDLWIPVVVVVGVLFVLLAPFLESPQPVFIAALILIGLSLLCYYPITIVKEKSIVNIPDNITIWLQLLLRIAPKRDLRRERRSMMRRMSMLARESILITPNVQTPEMMRRFSRRMSRLSRADGGSPALIRRMGDEEPHLRRRVNRGSSLAEADMKRGRSNSLWHITESKPSPALIRKKPQRNSRSFGHADVAHLPSPPSLPILKNRFNTTPIAPSEAEPGALAPPTATLHPPHHPVRPTPSPIPEESSSAPASPIDANVPPKLPKTKGADDDSNSNLEVVADFESDGGGEYEVLAHAGGVRRMAFPPDGALMSDRTDSSSSESGSETESEDSNKLRHSIFATLFAPNSSTSTSESDSSMDEEGEVDEEGEMEEHAHPSFYYSDGELSSDLSDNDEGDHNNQGHVNNGFVLHVEDDEGKPPKANPHDTEA